MGEAGDKLAVVDSTVEVEGLMRAVNICVSIFLVYIFTRVSVYVTREDRGCEVPIDRGSFLLSPFSACSKIKAKLHLRGLSNYQLLHV